MKVSEVYEVNEAFKTLGEEKLPFKLALAVARNMEKLRVVIGVISAQRKELAEKHIAKDENGAYIEAGDGTYKLADPKAYSEELTELLGTEVEVEELEKIPAFDSSGLEIEPAKLIPILKYLE